MTNQLDDADMSGNHCLWNVRRRARTPPEPCSGGKNIWGACLGLVWRPGCCLRRHTEHNIISPLLGLGADRTNRQHNESSASTTNPILVVHLPCIYSLNHKEQENKGGSSAIKELNLIRPWSCGTDDHFCGADGKLIIQYTYLTKIAFVHTAVRNATTSR